MSNPPQKQQLLKKQHNSTKQKPSLEEQKKKQAEVLKRREQERHQRAIAIAKKERADKNKRRKLRLLSVLATIVIVSLIVIPKPKLIHYQKLSVEAYSIYVPGIIEKNGSLIDSEQTAIIDTKLNLLFLCRGDQKTGECLQYEIIETRGIFITIWFWFKNYFRWDMLFGDDKNPKQSSPAN